MFVQLTIFTPTNQSHLGIKFDDYTKLNTRNTDKFLQQLFSGLGLKNIYFFDTFETRKTGKIDLYNSVVMDNEAMLCLRCMNGAKKSLYMAVRNAIAHGNIIYDGRYYILYSVSDDKIEYEGRLWSLSAFTAEFLPEEQQNNSRAYQGPKYFSYNGKTM